MNAFDEMSEDLTSMMIALDSLPDPSCAERLIKALERAHAEACKASLALRDELNRAAESRLRQVKKATPRGLPLVVVGLTAVRLAAVAEFGGRFV